MPKFKFLISVIAILLGCIAAQISYATNDSGTKDEFVSSIHSEEYNTTSPKHNALYRKEHRVLTVEPGDTFIGILTKIGMDNKTAAEAYNVLKKVYDTRHLRAGQHIELTGTFDVQFRQLEMLDTLTIEPERGTKYILRVNEYDKFEAKVEQEKFEHDVRVVEGSVSGLSFVSMIKAGVPNRLAMEVINRMSYLINFRTDVHKGDTFKIKYDVSKDATGKVMEVGNLLSATFKSDGRTYKIYRFKDNYYNEKGETKKTGLDIKPLLFRDAVASKSSSSGVDYTAPTGTPVYASGNGVIEVIKYDDVDGNYIKIRHNSQYETGYGHMQRFASGIRPGVHVRKGQIIGYVGSTGRSTGPHLHFEIILKGQRINPLKSKVVTIGQDLIGEQLKEFKDEMKRIDEIQGSDLPDTYQEEIKLVEDSITLVYGTKEYFYIYTGSDISKENLDDVIDEIRSEIGHNAGFSIYDEENASELAYMDWVAMSSYDSFPQSFHDNLKYCYNYKREHSLVEANSTGLVVFSNYELDKTYQENKRNGTYKHCNPREFVEQNIQKVRDIDSQRKDERKAFEQISSNRQLKKQCWDIIKTKFRYVNDLSFNDDMSIEQKNDTYTFSGVLNVETTNNLQASAEYKCVYNGSTKEFVDWFVGELEPTTSYNHNVQTPTRKPEYTHVKNQEDLVKQYPLCNPRYLFFTQDKCRENNINGNFFRVLQQTPDGTLVSFIKSPDYVLLISKNPKDASLPDNSPIYDGSFAVDGTYQYISVLGVTKTVKVLKRLK